MAYLCKNGETQKKIQSFINEYVQKHVVSPSIRDIAAGTGLSRATVQRYMAAMRERGEIDYGRRNITTEFTRRIETERAVVMQVGAVSCGIPKDPYEGGCEYVSIPRSWVGEGIFYIVEADGDSMTDAGIDDGDLVIVRKTDEAADGEIAVVLVDRSETTLKRFYRMPSERAYRLHAENSSYRGEARDRIVKNAEIQGVAVRVIKKLQ